MRLTRRFVLAAGAALWGCNTVKPTDAPSKAGGFSELETRAGGRLGVAIVSAGKGLIGGHRAGERFGMCSTFKMALAGLVLRKADMGKLSLEEMVTYSGSDLLGASEVTRAHLDQGALPVRALTEAAVVTSDNTAANLLLTKLGGPFAYTAGLREIGDSATRLDRSEPEMNRVLPGDERDTTTPAAMAHTMLAFLAGAALSTSSQKVLLDWMRRSQTGLHRLRAGLPAAWQGGDKTGTGVSAGMANKYNDIAIVFPPGRGPTAIAAYYEAPGSFPNIRPEDEAVLAEVGRLATAVAA